tara:strand:+ start:115330 stop:115953 length:624 start_codon:yes stop_codon:yes gene_type:complete
MFVYTVAFFATLPLRVGIIWRNFQCWRFGKVARKQEDRIYELSKHVLNSFISEDKTINYIEYHSQLSLGYPTKENGERFSEICWEAPICFTIFHNDKPLVGMGLEFRGSALCIWQLQGVRGAKVPETIRKWPALFVEGAKKFASETKEIRSVRVYAADQRISYRFPEGDLSEADMCRHQRNLRRRYDGTARQQGFKKVSKRYWEWKG